MSVRIIPTNPGDFDLSDGEVQVEALLKKHNYKFWTQPRVLGLEGDTKPNGRRADFYLTNHKVILEFQGMWKIDGRHDKNIEDYKEKLELYKKNDVDYIEIFPGQLTHINHRIKTKLEEIFIKRSEKEREEKELKEAKIKEEQKKETEKKRRTKKPVSKKQEPVTITVNPTPPSKKNKETHNSSNQSWDIRVVFFIIMILIIIFTIISIIANQETNKAPESQKSLQDNKDINKTPNQTQPKKTINKTSIIKEILETNKYDNKEVTITGGYDFSTNPNYKGYITDEQGNKILFTGTNRGFNPSKKYEYTGNITLTNEIKYLKITKSINDVNP